tara:strand:- start:579 stop:827 length:249 start_codon:yes stop_codon:yes gene_type:complete
MNKRMRQIKDANELNNIIENNPYILSLEPEETNVLVEVVTDFQNRNYEKAPKTESLLKALKEIQVGQKDIPVLEPNCDICED